MRKVILFVLSITVLQTISAKTPDHGFHIEKEQEKVISFRVDYPQNADVTVSFRDETSFILYEEAFSRTNLVSKKFDLVNLPDGLFRIELEDSNQIVTYDIEIIGKDLIIGDKSEIIKPKFNQNDQLVKMALGITGAVDGKISIYDMDDNILYEEKIENRKSIHKTFDFSKVYRGTYLLKTFINGRNFEYLVHM